MDFRWIYSNFRLLLFLELQGFRFVSSLHPSIFFFACFLYKILPLQPISYIRGVISSVTDCKKNLIACDYVRTFL